MSVMDVQQGGPAAPPVLLVDFAATGNSNLFRKSGWSGQEPDSVWTIGPRSTLQLPPVATPEDVILDLDINPCLLPQAGVQAQWLAVSLNGHLLGGIRVTGPCCVQIPVPAGVLRPLKADEAQLDAGPNQTLTFEHHGFIRPDQFGGSKDNRPLAIRFFGLRLYPRSLSATIDALQKLRAGVARLETAPVAHENRPHTADRAGLGYVPLKATLPTVGDHLGDAPRHEPATVSAQAGETTLDEARLGEGWHVGEDGVVWTAALFCHVELPVPCAPGSVSVSIGAAPLVIKDLLPAQRLIVLAHGVLLGQFRLTRETALSLAVPDGLIAAGDTALPLTFFLPDAIPMRQFAGGDPGHRLAVALDWVAIQPVPAGLRHAAALRGDDVLPLAPVAVSDRFVDLPPESVHQAVEAELGIKPAEVMRGFESLGDNCAFGLAQRKAGAEILGLLRFANTSLRALLRGLADGFQAALQKSEIELYLHNEGNPREYLLQIARYGIRWHTLVHEPDADAATVGREQIIKLSFLRRKFDEGLRNGRKICVLVRSEPRKVEVVMPGWGAPDKPSATLGPIQLMPLWDAPRAYEEAPPPLCVAEAMAVLLELNRVGPNTLLFLTPCPPGKRPGTVELLAPGLMRGYMSSFVILPQVETPNDVDWLRVAANAWLLKREFAAMTQLTDAA